MHGLARTRLTQSFVSRQVVSEPNLLARREPQARAGEKRSYGLALEMETYRDVRVYGYGGLLAGYTSYMFFLPGVWRFRRPPQAIQVPGSFGKDVLPIVTIGDSR